MKASTIISWMVAAIVVLGAVAYADTRSEANAALRDFAMERVTVARAAAGAFRIAKDATDSAIVEDAAVRLRALEQPGEVHVLVSFPGVVGLKGLDGTVVRSSPIEAYIAKGMFEPPWVRLTHEHSAELGLPARTAMASFATVSRPSGAPFQLVLVTTARRERDREERGQWRVFLAFVLCSGIVVTFGSLALRRQRKDLELEQRVLMAETTRASDERLARANKLAMFGALATGIAHQVATPLGVIVARADRLAPRVKDDERAVRAVEAISSQARRINEIIRVFLGIARGGTPTLRRTESESLARAAVDLVSHRFATAAVSISCTVDEGVPPIVCDRNLFEQAIVNLLLNACEACEQGGHVELSIRRNENRVAFVVEDDGVGIKSEDAVRATEPFFTTKPPGEGTGLGLAIASEIVNHHNGTLSLESRFTEGKRGTRARIELNAAVEEGLS